LFDNKTLEQTSLLPAYESVDCKDLSVQRKSHFLTRKGGSPVHIMQRLARGMVIERPFLAPSSVPAQVFDSLVLPVISAGQHIAELCGRPLQSCGVKLGCFGLCFTAFLKLRQDFLFGIDHGRTQDCVFIIHVPPSLNIPQRSLPCLLQG
jgi:hypothetical protein